MTAGLPDGIAAAHTYSPEEWRATAWQALREFAQGGETFTVDALRRHGVPDPEVHQHMGAMFAVARNLGLLELVGFTSHAQPNRAVAPLRVWKGTPKALEASAWAETPAPGPGAGDTK
ncbi:hypothetical protein ACWCOM_04970 [Kocuria sp. KH4]